MESIDEYVIQIALSVLYALIIPGRLAEYLSMGYAIVSDRQSRSRQLPWEPKSVRQISSYHLPLQVVPDSPSTHTRHPNLFIATQISPALIELLSRFQHTWAALGMWMACGNGLGNLWFGNHVSLQYVPNKSLIPSSVSCLYILTFSWYQQIYQLPFSQ